MEAKIEPGVAWFVEMLNLTVATTHASCEGHPDGWYILFETDDESARLIASLGFFNVEVQRLPDFYRLSLCAENEKHKDEVLALAKKSWEVGLGSMDHIKDDYRRLDKFLKEHRNKNFFPERKHRRKIK